ncbi:Exosome complex component rrp4 [Teratosphaeria destructans]|uniref:Exosome complex component rrp4 n=1 Tax=Teratosphaeria destructans TaxID=418781 RepID=A0A9W7SVS0_9PEZI|nr:Exosome complex component rrp4 [Teratosphaeria destructans]
MPLLITPPAPATPPPSSPTPTSPSEMDLDDQPTLITPGQTITSDPQWMRGHGTFAAPDHPTIRSTLAGTLQKPTNSSPSPRCAPATRRDRRPGHRPHPTRSSQCETASPSSRASTSLPS